MIVEQAHSSFYLLGWRWPLALLLGGLAQSSCFTPDRVERLVDGRSVMGRFVDERAYAYYARGLLLEHDGNLPYALESYQQAQAYDEASVEVSTRIASTLCQLHRTEAFSAFERARDLDASYAPLFTAWSRCYLLIGDKPRAMEAAEAAVSLDPRGVETNQQAVVVLLALGETARFRAWIRGLLAYPSLDEVTLRWLTELGETDLMVRDEVRLHRRQREPERAARLRANERTLFEALVAGDEARFTGLGKAQKMRDSELASFAFKAGSLSVARRVAERSYAADRSDGDSWIVLLALAAFDADTAHFEQLLRDAPSSPNGLRADSAEFLQALLESKTGTAFNAR